MSSAASPCELPCGSPPHTIEPATIAVAPGCAGIADPAVEVPPLLSLLPPPPDDMDTPSTAPHARVVLHPTSYRSSRPSPSSTSPAASTSSTSLPSPLTSIPFFAPPATPAYSPHVPYTSTAPLYTTRQPQEAQGLTPPDLSSLPLLDEHSRIHVLTAAQLIKLKESYSHVELPVDELFPYLHGGVDKRGSASWEYFQRNSFASGVGREGVGRTPVYRGLTVVHAHQPRLVPPPLSSFSSRSPSPTPTASSSSSSRSSYSPSVTSPSLSVREEGILHSLLLDSFAPEQILNIPSTLLASKSSSDYYLHHSPAYPYPYLDRDNLATFKIPPPSPVVTLRNFGLQPALYASLSDICVYGPNGVDEDVMEVAQWMVEAQDEAFRARGGVGVRHNVFVVGQEFGVFEREHPDAIRIDAEGRERGRRSLVERDEEEMACMTGASRIGEGVWLGNDRDMPAYAEGGDGNSNPFAFAITIGAHDSVSIPPSSLLSLESSRLCQLEEESLGMWEDIAVFTDAQETISLDSISTSSETTSSDVECLGVALCDISRLSFGPCTSAVVPPEYQSTFIRDIVTYSLWIRDQASPSSSALPRRVLIHCQDGYTDSSLLALTYLMVSRRINAAQAYLVLQMECGRSFHVYNADVQLIRRIEKRVKTELEREERDGREGGSLSEGMARSDSGFVEGQVQTTGEMRAKEMREELKLSNPVDDAWFYAPTWEGVFPSRITPFLYLGNLSHATNALLLKSLGITHVISMGESALQPPSATPSPLPTNSLWMEELLGSISVLDVKSIADDGIDPIAPHLLPTSEFIENARKGGGRVLVHCRVGVSRSASVVIAYLMKYGGMDLVTAYLVTRSRRLNILIQPNLPFAATLHAFEGELLRSIEAQKGSLSSSAPIDDERVLSRRNRRPWSVVAQEIHDLNARFLG